MTINKDVFVSNEGFIRPYAQILPNGRVFEDRQYLFPFSMTELILNPKLVQNPGWDKP
nr:RagB/SusD family nutrient uptake outer membrane protein [Sphingobacterium hungaricum]